MSRVVCLLLLLLALPGAAVADDDLSTWLASLDPERPASGPVARYEGGEPLADVHEELLASALQSGDPRVSHVAVDELISYGPPAGEALLLAAAADSTVPESVRLEALRALRSMNSGRALPTLGRVAMSTEGVLQREAILGLCALEAPEAGPLLRVLAERGDRKTQHWIVKGLRQAGARAAARGARRENREVRKDDRRENREERREDREDRREERQERKQLRQLSR
ncbi:MAG: HEAT repeat domain-containing protein [Deltaproteobacteria bacterium]|nr:HEAT repeat domain-containing protein [Deltaproteobacteria bacterium]